MADVIVGDNWKKLKGATNCYIPKLIQWSEHPTAGFRNVQLAQAAKAKAVPSFSQHVVGRLMDREALTHDKCRDFLKAYEGLDDLIKDVHGELVHTDIVAAVFAIPSLSTLLSKSDLTIETLSQTSGVSQKAIDHAVGARAKVGRVTAGIAHALHSSLSVLKVVVPPLDEFATSDPSEKLADKKILDKPFTTADLILPTPTNIPNPWL